jgi:APA family basic amino acid/polyamine antiporter
VASTIYIRRLLQIEVTHNEAAQEGLRRELTLSSATALVVGEVIAVGIFLTPAEMAKSLGSPLLVILVWLAMGGMALSGAFCYGELAARYPRTGGGYAYLREAYGPRLGFLYGWKCFLVMDPGLTAALAVGMASYASYIVPLSPIETKAVAIVAVIALAATNILGVRLGARLLRTLAMLKIVSLGFLVFWSILGRFGDWGNLKPFAEQRPGSAPLLTAIAGGMLAGFFSFGGWWDLSKMGGEVREPERTLPRAIGFGVCIVTLLYVSTSVAFMYLVPFERVTSGETFAAQAGQALFGAAGARVFSLIVVVSVLGSLTAIIMAAPRVYYAMAADGLFFKAAAVIHPRFGTPARAITLQAGLASVLIMLGTFQQIITYFIFVTVIFIGLTVAALFVLRRRLKDSPYRAPGYPATPLLFLGLVVLLLVLIAGQDPKQAFLGVAVVGLGVPAYELVVRKRR